jgi:hypothetical protein
MSHLHHLVSLLAYNIISRFLHLRTTVLNLKLEGVVYLLAVVLVVLVVEKMPKNVLLVLLKHSVFSSDKGGKESQMFGWQCALFILLDLGEERSY